MSKMRPKCYIKHAIDFKARPDSGGALLIFFCMKNVVSFIIDIN